MKFKKLKHIDFTAIIEKREDGIRFAFKVFKHTKVSLQDSFDLVYNLRNSNGFNFILF